ncbi:MAG: hypothetical protein PHV48_06310 [Candidatus Omnitrophica bacterium]|nr:hypothetical protein [Candidatus Omnitrophota bacterium]
MSVKKIIMIILIAVLLFTVALLIAININLFREISRVSSESKEMPRVVQEMPELNYAIPSNSITSGQIDADTVTGVMERRKALIEQELEAARARSIRRAEAFMLQKELEASLMHAGAQEAKAIPSKKDIELPSAEDTKDMESRGIISF